jgi:peptidoglycan/xylan/chitin deacetylase (PgdA/CDA1 family)
MGRLWRACVLAVVCACSGADADGSGRASGSPAETIVSLTFDDTLADQLLARPMLETRGLRATFYLNSSRLGGVGLDASAYMTTEDARALLAAGHEIGGHTISHLAMPTLDPDEQRRQACDDRARLLALGFPVRAFAYPRGATNAETAALVAECGYDSARLTDGLSEAEPAETTPPRDPFALRAAITVHSTTTLAELQALVVRAEARGGWVPLLMHHVCDGCSVDAIAPKTLDDFTAWLAARRDRGTVVKTVGEVMPGAVRPAVSAPAAPARPRTGNLLANPSLEADPRTSGVADCWMAATGSIATPQWTRSTRAHEGAFAEALGGDPQTSSSDRRLASRMDQGGCAPAATPGHVYALSAWYVASAPVVLVAFQRDAGGLWRRFAEGKPLPASAGWAQASFTLPPAPEGATALSVGIALTAPGTLIADDFALVDVTP